MIAVKRIELILEKYVMNSQYASSPLSFTRAVKPVFSDY
jgi:hypothetical protein